MSELQLQGFAKPFFIQYRIEEVDDYSTKAEFGASEGSQRAHERVARVTVRVGDYKTDSSGGRGDGALQLAASGRRSDCAAIGAVGGHGYGVQERARGLRAEAGRAEAGADAAAGRRLQPREAADLARRAGNAEGGWRRLDAAHGASQRALPERSGSPGGRGERAVLDGAVSWAGDNHLAGDERRNHRAQVGAAIPGSDCRGHAGAGWHAAGPLVCLDGKLAEGSRRAGGFRKTCARTDCFAGRVAQGAAGRRGVSRAAAAELRCRRRYAAQSAGWRQ